MKKHFLLVGLSVVLVLGFVRCSGDADTDSDNPVNPDIPKPIAAQLSAPLNNDEFYLGDEVKVEIKVNDPSRVNALSLYMDDSLYSGNLNAEDQVITINTEAGRVGKTTLYLAYNDENGKKHTDNRMVIFFSDIEPETKTAKIVNTYPHSTSSYTQGLEFYEGEFYEGTGQYNQSVLSKVDLVSGTRMKELPLDGSVFGEGITILNDTIYQLTYRSQICYVYDMDFNLLTTFNYDGEGWGLCNDGTNLIMSNGSDEIVWRNPQTFEIVKTRPVFGPASSYVNLNELELINGNLFANIYTQREIIEIDTASGKVLSVIDCNDLVNDAFEPGMDVLNGIAYNPATGKTYMTGKLWPKLYEVTFE